MDLDLLHSVVFDERIDENKLWNGAYKIPWNDPSFSARMLHEHLSQDHGLASRKTGTIQKQCAWIYKKIRRKKVCTVLDVGCGPGLYIRELQSLGYDCCGIDFSPASIDYARSITVSGTKLIHGDIRTTVFPSGFDLATMIYGEINVFSPQECRSILHKIYDAINPGGILLLEPQKYDTVKQIGQTPPTWFKAESGLFSDEPHICLMEKHWFDLQHTTLERFIVINTINGSVATYRSTTRAWHDQDFIHLLKQTGFTDITIQADWPAGNEGLFLVSACKPA